MNMFYLKTLTERKRKYSETRNKNCVGCKTIYKTSSSLVVTRVEIQLLEISLNNFLQFHFFN